MAMTLANELRRVCGHDSRSVDGCLHCEAADALESHLPQPAQEGLKVPDGCVLVAIERGEGYEDVHPDLVAEDCFGNAVERGWRYRVISPTDGEG